MLHQKDYTVIWFLKINFSLYASIDGFFFDLNSVILTLTKYS